MFTTTVTLKDSAATLLLTDELILRALVTANGVTKVIEDPDINIVYRQVKEAGGDKLGMLVCKKYLGVMMTQFKQLRLQRNGFLKKNKSNFLEIRAKAKKIAQAAKKTAKTKKVKKTE